MVIQAVSDAEVAAATNAAELTAKRQRLSEIEADITTQTGKTLEQINAMSLQERSAFWQTASADAQALKIEWNALNNEAADLARGQEALDTALQGANASVAAATAEVDKTTAAYEKAYGVMADTEAATTGADTVVDGLEEIGDAAVTPEAQPYIIGKQVQAYGKKVVQTLL